MPDDELVEKIRRIIGEAEDSQPINAFNFDWKGDAARAAIAIIVEECAKVADKHEEVSAENRNSPAKFMRGISPSRFAPSPQR